MPEKKEADASPELSAADLRQLEAQGTTVEEVKRQLRLFDRVPYLEVTAPCTVGNGIDAFSPEAAMRLSALYERERRKRRVVQFVPASGAASRMFAALWAPLKEPGVTNRSQVVQRAQTGDKQAKELLAFIDGLRGFAFYGELAGAMARDGHDLEQLLAAGEIREIVRYTLTDAGLDYANLPKGLLQFHRHGRESRTPFEEHLLEAAATIADEAGVCRVHFTVSPEHLQLFQSLLERARPGIEGRLHVNLEVSFSVQDPSTDTVAADTSNVPFRLDDGHLLFRKGGHGALLPNLDALGRQGAALIFLKNIDNVLPEESRAAALESKKVLGGYLLETQSHLFVFLERLARPRLDAGLLQEVEAFAARTKLFTVPAGLAGEEKRRFLFDRLNRPLRVCGMVVNTGQPGGGPYWVKDESGAVSRQIVESAQINLGLPQQKALFEAATHFNPVDVVLSPVDYQGRPFDLRRFVDPAAVFISQKTHSGRALKALEHPGLWNGAMADHLTLFVEVPAATFAPVKTVNDLLGPKHKIG